MRTVQLTSTLAAGLLAAGVFAGCSGKTEGERTIDESRKLEDAGQLIRRGERMVVDGTGKEAEGRTLKTQGKDVEGDRLITEGRALKAQGEALIQQGRAAKP